MRIISCCGLLSLIVLTIAMSLAQSVNAQSPGGFEDHRMMPEGTRGERVSALLEAFDKNSAEAVERFMAEHVTAEFRAMVPMEQHVSVFKATYRQTSGIDFYSIRTYDPPRPEIVVIARDRLYGGWHSLVLSFAENDLIDGIRFVPARAPADVDDAPLSRHDLIAEIRRAVDRSCERNVFSGAVLVAHQDAVLIEASCGEASKRFGVPNRVDTKFNLGSMNKMFTSTAIMQLVDAGRLDLHDAISEHIDESWLPREITESVTIHHLLTHTSGLGSYFNETFMNSSRALYRELDDYKPLVRGDTLAFTPGERFRYSNTGMLLLGVVIESVTGGSYFDYIRENIYGPAGMASSDSYDMDEPVPNLAIGYIPAPESEYGWRNNLFEHVVRGGPAGGGYSTVGDLHRFARALLGGELVASASLDTMWTAHSNAGYGYGFEISWGPAGKIVGHSGGFPGLNGKLDIYPDAGFVVAVLANHDRAASPLADHIRTLIGRLEDV